MLETSVILARLCQGCRRGLSGVWGPVEAAVAAQQRGCCFAWAGALELAQGIVADLQHDRSSEWQPHLHQPMKA